MSTPDSEAITRFFAKRVTKSAKKGAVNEAELAERIGEIELETQILGASFLKVHIIDPELVLLNSGWLELKEGLLEPIEVEFPEGSKWLWILCACEPSTEVSQANLELTFESKLVAEMREFWTPPKQAPPGTQTRAEFIRDLLREAKVPFYIPGVSKVQPIEEEEKGEEGQVIVQTAVEKERADAKAAKSPGIGSGSSVKVKGEAATKQQQNDIDTALSVARKLKAPPVATEALIVAGIGESTFHRESSNSGHNGIWQSDVIPGDEVARQAEAFLSGGESFQGGGAIKLANEGKSPGEIATTVEASGQPASFYEAYNAEAKAIIQAGGGTATSETGPAESDVAQLTRGTEGNPDEDTFECATRLAQQVNWFFFDDGHTVFYMDGPELAAQKPAAYIDIQENYVINAHSGKKQFGIVQQPTTGTIDDTTFEFRRTHKVKGKVQKRSKIAKPATPSEIRLQLVCEIDEYRAGEVFVIRGFGPFNGRWIISDATRNCLKDSFTKFILEPPIEPLPEPQATAKGAELTGETGRTEGYVNPLEKAKGLVAERVDQGVDYAMQAGSEILAIGDGEVVDIISNWFQGEPFLWYKLTNGKYAGKYVYVSEQINPVVSAKQKITAGQKIATYAATGTGIETGWAQPQGSTLAQSTGGYSEGERTAAGQSFSTFLEALGAPGGTVGGRPLVGKVPAGYP